MMTDKENVSMSDANMAHGNNNEPKIKKMVRPHLSLSSLSPSAFAPRSPLSLACLLFLSLGADAKGAHLGEIRHVHRFLQAR